MAISNDTEYQHFSASLLHSLASVITHLSHINTFPEAGAIQPVRSLARALKDIGYAEDTLREWFAVSYGRTTLEQQQVLEQVEWIHPFVVGIKGATEAARG